MDNKYVIKLRGTECYLRTTKENAINFTTDISKAKVFERIPQKMDIIDKLNAREFKVRKESHKTDNVRLTMDKATWQKLYTRNRSAIQEISDCRLGIHQYSMSLVGKFKAKAEAYELTGEHPNFECDYYGEDFERKSLS